MRLLRWEQGRFDFSDHGEDPPPYAILSHTWSENNDEEVTYQDVKQGADKPFTKLHWCREQAAKDGYTYFWIDTCCIDKRNDAEVAYAIRSMYRWYSNAAMCYVFLSDMSGDDELADCRWFTRGWTLQEMIASKQIKFFSRDGYLGDKHILLSQLSKLTGIKLEGPVTARHRTRLSWVQTRTTKRPEDMAYCMMGICGVVIDPRYGEGRQNAFRRLESEIVHRYGTIAMEEDAGTTEQDQRKLMLDSLRFDVMDYRRTTISMASLQTCSWVLDHPTCSRWLNSTITQHRIFWIKGKPGAGKSVLIKFLDQHVTEKVKGRGDVRLSFYFNARGHILEKSFEGLYRSLLVQLVDAVPALESIIDVPRAELIIKGDIGALKDTLQCAIAGLGNKRVWIFIDAVDECHEEDVDDMINFFIHLQQEFENNQISICFASRHYPILRIPTELQMVLEEIDDHADDLGKYVRDHLIMTHETQQKREKVKHDILAKASGIFLWVVLVVEILKRELRKGRVHNIEERLSQIPSGLSELFADILRKDSDDMDEFVLCLRWILYAVRPLKLPEWYYAIMAGLSDSTSSDLEWREIDVTEEAMHTFLLNSSKGLAELTKEQRTVQFIHESVRDFFLKDDGLREICGDIKQLDVDAEEQLKECCAKGLLYRLPEIQPVRGKLRIERYDEKMWRFHRRFPFAKYATMNILIHADNAAMSTPQKEFLENFELNAWYHKFDTFKTSRPQAYVEDINYGQVFAQEQLPNLLKTLDDPTLLLGSRNQVCSTPATTATAVTSRQSLVSLRANGQPKVSTMIAATTVADRPSISSLKSNGQCKFSPMMAAIARTQWETLKALLELNGANNAVEIVAEVKVKGGNTSGADFIEKPWRWAVKNNRVKLAKHLLSAVDSEELACDDGQGHALMLAIQGLSVTMVDTVLQVTKSLLEVPSWMAQTALGRNRTGVWTPLMLAIVLRRHDIAKLLILSGADVNTRALGISSLHLACIVKHKDLISELLKSRAIALCAGVCRPPQMRLLLSSIREFHDATLGTTEYVNEY